MARAPESAYFTTRATPPTVEAMTLPQPPAIPGIHHVTAITADPQANVDFYAGFLGQRFDNDRHGKNLTPTAVLRAHAKRRPVVLK